MVAVLRLVIMCGVEHPNDDIGNICGYLFTPTSKKDKKRPSEMGNYVTPIGYQKNKQNITLFSLHSSSVG